MRTKHTGFTLIEIMTVVTLIGLLAGMARLAVLHINLKARGTVFMNDCRVFSEAFQRYSIEKGGFPADQTTPGTLPPGMTGYLSEQAWLRPTPIGGKYDWDNQNISIGTSVMNYAAIKVIGCTWSVANLLQLDRWFDDGNLSSGRVIVTDAGTTVLFVIETGTGVGSSSPPSTDPAGGGGGDNPGGGAPSTWFLSLLAAAAAARAIQRRKSVVSGV